MGACDKEVAKKHKLGNMEKWNMRENQDLKFPGIRMLSEDTNNINMRNGTWEERTKVERYLCAVCDKESE